tara:strand:+ start:279 stop:569 length:291 start_codon:yes stop_codon:yes gene_type:complete
MAIYKNIASATTTTLTVKKVSKGNISKMLIANRSANPASVSVFLDDGTKQYYFIRGVVIPSGVSLLLDDAIAFDSTVYQLKITNTGTAPLIDVTIR